MAKSKVKIEFKSEGFRALATSPEAQAVVMSYAEGIALAAGEGFEARPAEKSKNRARAVVMPTTRDAIVAEATDKVLTRAIGRG